MTTAIQIDNNTTAKPSQVDNAMGAIVRASIDDFIKNAYYRFTERDIHPEVNYGDLVRADPDYQQAEAKEKALEAEVKKYLPENAHHLLDDYVNAISDVTYFGDRYSYKHGFIDGIAYSKLPERWAAELGVKLPEVKAETERDTVITTRNYKKANDFIHERYQDFLEHSSPDSQEFNYCDNERRAWARECKKTRLLEAKLENQTGYLDGMYQFRCFRAGFVAGTKHANGGLMRGGNA